MKLFSAEISGFRAFPRQAEFNLDADVVIVKGANGTGKTSLFDAILWGLTGRIQRFGGGTVLSLYSQSGEARVALTLGESEPTLRLVRSSDGSQVKFTVEMDGRELEGESAVVRMLEALWPAALATPEPLDAFATAFTRSVYLQQDLVRQFIESDTDEERFKVVGELVGVGRLTELQAELERARNSWTRARTELVSRVHEAAKDAAQLKSRLERLAGKEGSPAERLSDEWGAWWREARSFGVVVEPPPADSGRSSLVLGEALRLLQAERRAADRRRSAGQSLLTDLEKQPVMSEEERSEMERLRNELTELEARIGVMNGELAQAQVQAAEARRQQTVAKEAVEDLRALAMLALRHLDERCPVCDQGYDRTATKARLEVLVGRSTNAAAVPAGETAKRLSVDIAAAETAAAATRARLTQIEALARKIDEWNAAIPGRLVEAGLDEHVLDLLGTVRDALNEQSSRVDAIGVLYARGEQLALAVARAGEQTQRVALEEQLRSRDATLASLNGKLEAHNRTRDLATHILDGIREAGHVSVEKQVERIEPLVERVYSRIDPHPGFTKVKLLTAVRRGHGQISPVVSDPRVQFLDQDPLPVLSSSQLNALAVSVFLGLNLGVPAIPVKAVLLDDPLQSLDDVNLLGLVDTLRRTKSLRQLVVSTHDPRFASLLERKLRPVGNGERTLVINFEDWTRDGPEFTVSKLPSEAIDYRVTAA